MDAIIQNADVIVLFVLLVIVVPLMVGRVCKFNELEWDE